VLLQTLRGLPHRDFAGIEALSVIVLE